MSVLLHITYNSPFKNEAFDFIFSFKTFLFLDLLTKYLECMCRFLFPGILQRK